MGVLGFLGGLNGGGFGRIFGFLRVKKKKGEGLMVLFKVQKIWGFLWVQGGDRMGVGQNGDGGFNFLIQSFVPSVFVLLLFLTPQSPSSPHHHHHHLHLLIIITFTSSSSSSSSSPSPPLHHHHHHHLHLLFIIIIIITFTSSSSSSSSSPL